MSQAAKIFSINTICYTNNEICTLHSDCHCWLSVRYRLQKGRCLISTLSIIRVKMESKGLRYWTKVKIVEHKIRDACVYSLKSAFGTRAPGGGGIYGSPYQAHWCSVISSATTEINYHKGQLQEPVCKMSQNFPMRPARTFHALTRLLRPIACKHVTSFRRKEKETFQHLLVPIAVRDVLFCTIASHQFCWVVDCHQSPANRSVQSPQKERTSGNDVLRVVGKQHCSTNCPINPFSRDKQWICI